MSKRSVTGYTLGYKVTANYVNGALTNLYRVAILRSNLVTVRSLNAGDLSADSINSGYCLNISGSMSCEGLFDWPQCFL